MTDLRFPCLASLELALTSGLIPEAVAAAPVLVEFDAQGAICARTKLALPPESLEQLAALGVEEAGFPAAPGALMLHWLQILPLVATSEQTPVGDKTAVLFDMPAAQLVEVASEILRLGNDRQSYRLLASDAQQRALLRVLAPPYYTLLRCLDAKGETHAPRAFVEQRPRIWVELGHAHPLLAHYEVPPGKWLLLSAPRGWELIDEAPFQELYQALDFQLPATDSAWHDAPLQERLSVPLRLTTMAAVDDAELWVLEDNAWEQVEQLVQHSDNELLARLAFAVVEQQSRQLVLLRLRPSKLPPPVLILHGLACHRYLNLPNLFVPVGQRLHPPLRRDVVAKLLASNAQQLVWLQPQGTQGFRPRSVDDAHFRPLSQWVEYVLDHEQESLTAWMAAHRFDFASFVCADETPRATPPVVKDKAQRSAPPVAPMPEVVIEIATTSAEEEVVTAEVIEEPSRELASAPVIASAAVQRLASLEQQFSALTEPLDSPVRRGLWREMALLNGALDRRFDASLCWVHSWWEEPTIAAGEARQWWEHLGMGADSVFPTRGELQQVLDDPASRKPALLRLAAQLVVLSEQSVLKTPPELGFAAQVLAEHDNALPVRVAWLAWTALAKLTQGDTLALARARDRMLERLFQNGLTAEQDVAGFLRTASGHDGERQRVLRHELLTLRDRVAEWIVEPPSMLARTRAYADLIFAYGLAKLGESAQAEQITNWARQQIDTRDTLHSWSVQAFELRIGEATQGQRRAQLSPELLAIMQWMDRTDRYKADRLRQRSRIIEPFERIDPYRRWHRQYADDLARELALLFDVTDRDELLKALQAKLSAAPVSADARARILITALELAPRLGEPFAASLVERVFPAWEAIDNALDRAWLLEKALQSAAHYDQRDAVQAFVERFESSLADIIRSYLQLQADHNPSHQQKLVIIESLFNQSLRGLRKLGLRDEIGRIFSRIVDVLQAQAGAPQHHQGGKPKDDPTRALKLMLTVAGGWFYFGQVEQAKPIIDDARQKLFMANLAPVAKASLACAYINAVSQAPLEYALPNLAVLFEQQPGTKDAKLSGVLDPLTTSSHYSLAQLDVVEAIVLALVSDDAALSAETRRWLEEDEFLVRRRIHRDVRTLTAQAGL